MAGSLQVQQPAEDLARLNLAETVADQAAAQVMHAEEAHSSEAQVKCCDKRSTAE